MATNQQNTQQVPQTQQKNIVIREETCLNGKPLDFSFKSIKSLDELKTMEPRSGKRKEPPKDEEDSKEETKKVENEQDEENKQNQNETQSQKEEEGEKQDGQEANNSQKAKEKKEEKKVENKQPQVMRVIPTSTTHALITNSQVPSGSKTKGGAKVGGYQDEGKGNSQKHVIKINSICTSLILSYNKIRSLTNFKQNVEFVMFNNWKSNLSWIDLSHNYLESLDYGFNDVPNLKSLYLHCNYLTDLADLKQLQELPIRTLTIHGNPVETINNFRLYIIGILPQLKRLDSVVVSKKERDNCQVMVNTFKLKIPPPNKDAAKAPQENQPQTTQKQ